MGSLRLPKINTKMSTRTKSVEMSKIVSNSEIHLHHCLCEPSDFKIGRSNHQRCSVKKVFLKILQNWQKRNCVRAPHGFSTVSFTEYLRTLFLQNTSGWLLLMKRVDVQKFNTVSLICLNSKLYHAPSEWWLLFWCNEELFLIKKTWLNCKKQTFFLTLFQRQSRRGVQSRVHNFSKPTGKYLCKSLCVGASFG